MFVQSTKIAFSCPIINGVDYTNNVVNGTYEVNQEERFSEWEDANHRKHRADYHTKVVGSFDLFFKDTDDYEMFVSIVKDGRLSDGRCRVVCSVNNINADLDGFAYVSFAPARATNETVGDFFNQFTVTIEES